MHAGSLLKNEIVILFCAGVEGSIQAVRAGVGDGSGRQTVALTGVIGAVTV